MKNQILFDIIDSRFPAEVEFLAVLVRKPSDNPPGDCAGHAELTARALEALGFEVERHVVPADAVAGAGDMLGVLLGIGSGEQQFGAVRMANLTVAPREHVERLAHRRSAAGH